jgi:carbonic anhydrase
MLSNIPHTAKHFVLSCIDDRLTGAVSAFIASLPGGAFHAALAGGGAAILSEDTREAALKQIAAAYQINHATIVHLESHTDCGAYRLAGVTFSDPAEEITRLYSDLDRAGGLVRAALATAGAPDTSIVIQTRVVDPTGRLIQRPKAA